MERESVLKPGVYSLMRWLGVFQLGKFLFLTIVNSFDQNTSIQLLHQGSEFVLLLVLLGFLFWPKLPERLGIWFMPIAFSLAILIMYISQPDIFSIFVDEVYHQPNNYIIRFLRGISVMAVLSLLMVWQYNWKSMTLLNLFTVLVDLTMYLATPIKQPMMISVLLASISARLLVLPILGYVVQRLIESHQEQQRILAQTNQQLTQYALTLEQLAISRERNRLARELHDTLAHTLSGLAVQLEALRAVWDSDPDKARKLLDDALSNTRAGMHESRRALHSLRATPIEELGVVQALRLLAESYAQRHQLQLDLQLPKQLELKPEYEQCLYRIAQEALENTVRHADASQIGLQLMQQRQQVILSVHDNGRGFVEQQSDSQRLGLRGMYERARLVGGQLKVQSAVGQGTKIQFILGKNHDQYPDLR